MPKKPSLAELKKQTDQKIKKESKAKRKQTKEPSSEVYSKSGNKYCKSKLEKIREPGIGSGNSAKSKDTQFGGKRANNGFSLGFFLENMHGGEQEFNLLKKHYRTPEARKGLCERFCKHLGEGNSPYSFEELGAKTVQKYMQDFPVDFPPKVVFAACRKGLLFWEAALKGSAMGVLKKANVLAIKFFMNNAFKWGERHDITTDGEMLTPIVHEYPKKPKDE